MKIRQLFVCLVLTFNCFLTAQQFPSYSYTLEKELSSSAIFDIRQDHDGFIWLATGRGVCRYDGYSFRNFTQRDSMINQAIFNIYEDRFNRLWFSTGSSLLYYYDRDGFHRYPYADSIAAHLAKKSRLRTLDVAPDSSLLLGFTYGGLLRVSTRGVVTKPAGEDMNNCFLAVMAGGNWGGFSVGLNLPRQKDSTRMACYEIDGHRRSFRYVAKGGNEMPTVIRRRNGNCSILTGGLFIELSATKEPVVVPLGYEAIRVCEDNDSCLWISAPGGGVTRYSPNAVPGANPGVRYFSDWLVSCVIQDYEGGFWISDMHGDLHYVSSLAYELVPDGMPDQSGLIGAMGYPDRFYTVRTGGYVNEWKNGKWTTYDVTGDKDRSSNQMMNFNVSRVDDEVLVGFVGGNTGVFSLQPNGTWRKIINSYVRSLSMDRDTLFIITPGGIYKTRRKEGPFPGELILLSAKGVFRDVYRGEDGTLYLVGNDGMYYLDHGLPLPLDTLDPLLNMRPVEMMDLADGRLVWSVQGKGVVLYNPKTRRSHLIGAEQGLAGTMFNRLSPASDGSLWVQSDAGVSQVRLFSDSVFNVRNFPIWFCNGNDVLGISAEKEIWLTTRKGLVRFKPELLKKNSTPPRVHLLFIQVNDSLLADTAARSFAYTMNSFRISFVGLAYHMHGKVKYHYCLEGFSKDTVSTFSTEALFLSLPPGNYVFKVWAENEDGVWSSKPATFAFTITPPFWKTGWFITLAIVVILLAIIITLVRIFRRVQRENKMRENLLEYQQQALVSQINPHFIFNSLNTIQSYMFREDKENSARFLSRFSKLMRMSLDHSRLKTVPLPDELSLIRVYLELEAMRFPETLKWSIDVSPEIPQEKLEVPSMLIQPYIENAIKHGIMNRPGEKGEVIVRLEMQEKFLLCTIEDNGVGRAAAAKAKTDPQHHSAGSTITEQRLRLICRAMHCPFLLEFSDRLDHAGNVAGTIVKFGLPYRVL